MKEVPFIAVEGPIGVGKTSLAKAISSAFHFSLFLEIVEENPFLEKFYKNMDEWSFQTEMYFLCNRYKQLNDIKNDYLSKNKPVVSDYHIMKNLIFAKRTLKNEEYHKYRQIYQILTTDMPVPNMMIYLKAELDTLLGRIKQRDRLIEKTISPLYLQNLLKDYEDAISLFKKEHPTVPVLYVTGDEIDFVNNHQDLNDILKKISTSMQ